MSSHFGVKLFSDRADLGDYRKFPGTIHDKVSFSKLLLVKDNLFEHLPDF